MNNPYDHDSPCALCGDDPYHCTCPPCPVCGMVGDPSCESRHRQELASHAGDMGMCDLHPQTRACMIFTLFADSKSETVRQCADCVADYISDQLILMDTEENNFPSLEGKIDHE